VYEQHNHPTFKHGHGRRMYHAIVRIMCEQHGCHVVHLDSHESVSQELAESLSLAFRMCSFTVHTSFYETPVVETRYDDKKWARQTGGDEEIPF